MILLRDIHSQNIALVSTLDFRKSDLTCLAYLSTVEIPLLGCRINSLLAHTMLVVLLTAMAFGGILQSGCAHSPLFVPPITSLST